MPFQLQDISLIHPPIPFDCILLLYLKILELSSTKALITLLHSGISLIATSSLLIQQSIKKPNSQKLTLFSHANPHGILTRKKNGFNFKELTNNFSSFRLQGEEHPRLI